MGGPVKVHASESTAALEHEGTFDLPGGTTHFAIHWTGHSNAQLTVASSSDGSVFGPASVVEIDEVGSSRGDGETYGAVTPASGVAAIRLTTSEPLDAVSILTLDAANQVTIPLGIGAVAAGAGELPPVISRSAWGADESIRFDSQGEIRWGLAYYPLQKFIVHHTVTGNSDPNPAATVRAIYYYHAVTQDWGDIGYNYLVDAAGRIYEGKYSRDYAPGVTPTSDNEEGLLVEGGHALGYNPGSMGIALMGTFDTRAPTAQAQSSLVRLIAWAAIRNGLDPRIWSSYVNPVSGKTRWTANISGHRDYNSTACPGGLLYPLLPSIRSRVAAEIISRLAGGDRYATAAAISAATFAPGVPVAYIATGQNYPDALAGSGPATLAGGPLLLVTTTGIPAVTAAELTRLQPGQIIVLGGPSVVSEAVRIALGAYATGGGQVSRLAGGDRYATAAAISAATFAPGVPVAYIATGQNYPDALAGSGPATLAGGPLLLVTTTGIPAVTAAELTRLQPGQIIVLGGPSVVSEAVRIALGAYATGGGQVSRLAGGDRYATAAAISAATFAPGVPVAYIATGQNYPDALAGSGPATLAGGPLLLVTTTGIPAVTAAELTRLQPGQIIVLGGPSVVSEAVRMALGAYPQWPPATLPPTPPPPGP